MKKICFLACAFTLVLTSSGCNKSRNAVYKGGGYSLNSMFSMSPNSSGYVLQLDTIGWEASVINDKIEPPIKNIFIMFNHDKVVIGVEDSHDDNNYRELQMSFKINPWSCGVYQDNFGKVKVEKVNNKYTISFSDNQNNWYILGELYKKPPIDCLQ